MITISIGNSESKIDGLTISQHRELRSVLSYDTTQYNSYAKFKFGPKKVYLIDKNCIFATGLLKLVLEHFKSLKLPITSKDLRIEPTRGQGLFKMDESRLTPYPEQIEIVDTLLTHKRGVISAITGFGKSISMVLLAHRLQVRTLIVVPNLGLKEQLQATFDRFFGPTKDLVIENIDSPSLKNHTKFDLLIIDEAHHGAAITYRKLNKTAWKNIFYRAFFTSTPFRSKSEENILLESIAGQVIYTVDYHKAVAKKYIVPVEAYFIELPKIEPTGNQRSWPSMYSELVVNNQARNEIIARFIKSVYKQKLSTLVLVKEIKHGANLAELTGAAFTNGEDEASKVYIDAFNAKKLTVLIGTVGVIGEGIDSKPAEWIIITGLGKSKNQFLQNCGRGVRRFAGKQSCKVLIFKDMSHKYTASHFREQCKILLDVYGIKPKKINIS